MFQKSTGRLIGFCDLGQVNHEIDRLFHPFVKAAVQVQVIKFLSWLKHASVYDQANLASIACFHDSCISHYSVNRLQAFSDDLKYH